MTQPLRFKMTCGACPEQYDVFLGEEQVGYVRLRHGTLRVDSPDCGGRVVYEASPNGDGCFDTPEERDFHLRHAGAAILKWIADGKPQEPAELPPAPEIDYVLEDFYDPWGE
jgi:hypothetical protein